MILEAYSTTIDINHLSDTAGAFLASQEGDAILKFLNSIEAINERHFGKTYVGIHSTDFWAGVLVHASHTEVSLKTVLKRLTPFGDSFESRMKPEYFDRLLFALAVVAGDVDVDADVRQQSIVHLDAILAQTPAVLDVLSWKVVRYGMQLYDSACCGKSLTYCSCSDDAESATEAFIQA